jgi:hypothetical protein
MTRLPIVMRTATHSVATIFTAIVRGSGMASQCNPRTGFTPRGRVFSPARGSEWCGNRAPGRALPSLFLRGSGCDGPPSSVAPLRTVNGVGLRGAAALLFMLWGRSHWAERPQLYKHALSYSRFSQQFRVRHLSEVAKSSQLQ